VGVLRVVVPSRTDRAFVVLSSRRVEVIVTTGTIKKVVSDRGFGFIAAEDGKEYFFHRNGLTSSLDFDRLTGGEKVQFQIEQSPKGPRATNVQSA
jgi:cold shock protein